MGYSSSYWKQVIAGYEALGKRAPQDALSGLREALAVEEKVDRAEAEAHRHFAVEEEERLREWRDGFFQFRDAGWPVKGANWRGNHTLRALSIFTGRSVDAVHDELVRSFRTANLDRKASSQKHEREERQLLQRTEVPNWLIREHWVVEQGLVEVFKKGFGDKGLLLRPEVVPADCLVCLTKDWVAVVGGKVTASWNPLWHDHRSVSGVWTVS